MYLLLQRYAIIESYFSVNQHFYWGTRQKYFYWEQGKSQQWFNCDVLTFVGLSFDV